MHASAGAETFGGVSSVRELPAPPQPRPPSNSETGSLARPPHAHIKTNSTSSVQYGFTSQAVAPLYFSSPRPPSSEFSSSEKITLVQLLPLLDRAVLPLRIFYMPVNALSWANRPVPFSFNAYTPLESPGRPTPPPCLTSPAPHVHLRATASHPSQRGVHRIRGAEERMRTWSVIRTR